MKIWACANIKKTRIIWKHLILKSEGLKRVSKSKRSKRVQIRYFQIMIFFLILIYGQNFICLDEMRLTTPFSTAFFNLPHFACWEVCWFNFFSIQFCSHLPIFIFNALEPKTQFQYRNCCMPVSTCYQVTLVFFRTNSRFLIISRKINYF